MRMDFAISKVRFIRCSPQLNSSFVFVIRLVAVQCPLGTKFFVVVFFLCIESNTEFLEQ